MLCGLTVVWFTKFMLELFVMPVLSDEEWEIQRCIRPAPHVCRENGPCNGWPKDQEGQDATVINYFKSETPWINIQARPKDDQ